MAGQPKVLNRYDPDFFTECTKAYEKALNNGYSYPHIWEAVGRAHKLILTDPTEVENLFGFMRDKLGSRA